MLLCSRIFGLSIALVVGAAPAALAKSSKAARLYIYHPDRPNQSPKVLEPSNAAKDLPLPKAPLFTLPTRGSPAQSKPVSLDPAPSKD